ncbi:MAG: hypothetical protein K2L49_03855, partial [Muribaculaceae bacterium]|nr:hypothetical protein [Muribaculaceae bacterium]
MRAALIYIFITGLVCMVTAAGADPVVAAGLMSDSTAFAVGDSVHNYVTAVDTMPKPVSRIRREKVDLDNQVQFESKDSMVLIGKSTSYMYGDAKVTYGDIKLDADNIEMDMRTSTVYAVGTTDSVGDVIGSPVFEDGGDHYESETMRYNFKTEKGYITNVQTQQGEGYLTGGTPKQNAAG